VVLSLVVSESGPSQVGDGVLEGSVVAGRTGDDADDARASVDLPVVVAGSDDCEALLSQFADKGVGGCDLEARHGVSFVISWFLALYCTVLMLMLSTG
jgi:hypothetical protein